MSLDNEILEQADLEALRLYDPHSMLHQEISAKIKQIFERLFQNTDIDINDFYFTGYDSNDANAFFLDASKTKNGKNIIAVSFGLIQNVSNTEELAAIIGHECGHYLWSQLLGGRNTIFQERAADLRSVDLMINAGYNPRNVLSAEQKVFGELKYSSPTLDVHSNPFNRVEDVKTYLAKLTLERGSFPDVAPSDPEYDKFKEKIKTIRAQQPYLSYIDKNLMLFLKSTNIEKITRTPQFRDALLMYLMTDIKNISENKTRLDQLEFIYKNFDFVANPPTNIETLNLRAIFNQLMELSNENDIIEPFLPSILSHSRLDAFDNFKDLFDAVSSFYKAASSSFYDTPYVSPEFWAEQILALKKYIPLAQNLVDFRQHVISFEPSPEIIGQKPFWVLLRERKDAQLNQALDLITRYPELLKYRVNDYLYDDQGCIIAYGEEMQKILFQRREAQNIERAQNNFDSMVSARTQDLADYQKIIDFLDGKIAPDDMQKSWLDKWVYLPQMGNTDYILQKYIDYIDTNRLMDFYNHLKSTAFYRDVTTKEIELPTNATNMDIYDKIGEILNMRSITVFYNTFDAYMKLAAHYHDTGDINAERNIYAQLDDVVSEAKRLIPDKNDSTSIWAVIYNHINNNLPRPASKNIFYCMPPLCDIMTDGIVNDLESNKSEIITNIMNTLGFKRLPQTEEELIFVIEKLGDYLFGKKYPDPDHEQDMRKAEKIFAAMKRYRHLFYNDALRIATEEVEREEAENQKNEPKDQDFAKDLYDDLPPETKYIMSSVHGRASDLSLAIPLLATFLNSGYKCNPVNVLKVCRKTYFYEMREFADIFTKLIPDESFNSLNLDDKIYLYEFLDTCRGFSKTNANKNRFIKQIVNEIITYPDYDIAVGYAERILMRKHIAFQEYDKNRLDIEFANEREKLLEFYSDYWANKLGQDDNSEESARAAQNLVNFLQDKDNNFSSSIAGELSDRIANKICAQENVTAILDSVNNKTIKGTDAERADYFGRGAEAFLNFVAKAPNVALATIEFINNELTDDSINTFINAIQSELKIHSYKMEAINFDVSYSEEFLTKESLTVLHENFWAANLQLRAYLMNHLLNGYSTKEDDKLQLILDMFFKSDSEYYDDAKLILKCIYQNLDSVERNLVLAALIASGKKSGENEMTAGTAVGRGLKMFLQNKGPAFIKFGQLLSYIPNLDPDIRHELSTLRDKAKIPSRAELFEMLTTSLPNSEYQKITHVGQILGAGSFFVTVQVKYDGKDCVISLMRPHTKKLTTDGINMIAKTIKDMAAKDKKFAVLQNIVNQARDSAYSEIDIEQDYEKYTEAIKIYESLKIHTPMGDYSPDVARWIAYGSAPDKTNSYKIMEMSPGVPLTSDELTEEERHDMALAYTTLELAILLSGNKWDTDRHAGNQNFLNKDLCEFCIGIFDTGAQMKTAPKRRDKRMIGYLLYTLINGIRDGKQISEILNTKIQDIDRLCKMFGISTAYIDGVQRGLTALSDIIQYQKEIRDDNGNIVQEAKSLTATDLENIAMAILQSGIIDKTLLNTTKAHFILDMLAFWKPKGELPTTNLEDYDNPISITVGPEITNQIQTRIINKAASEIEKIIEEKRKQEHLGVKIGLTEKKQDPTTPKNDFSNRM